MGDKEYPRVTGAPSGRDCTRACYAVWNHGDGTGTIVLDWYEMSIGRDHCHSEVFIRAEIETARKVVNLLNSQLPARVSASTEVDFSNIPEDIIDALKYTPTH